MLKVTSFSDKFLIKAASLYAYEMSDTCLYENPLFNVQLSMNLDFLHRYTIEKAEPSAFYRDDKLIDIRYLLVKDNQSEEYAMIYQGSDDSYLSIFTGENLDWSNNFSSAVHLKLENYKQAQLEFEYLLKSYKITAVSGNSLGGAYALNLAKDYQDIRIIGLNPAPPEFNKEFYNSNNATILITSSDILSRSLLTDTSRIEDNEAKSTSKIKSVYGYDAYFVNRSISYSNANNIKIGHVGSLINYRDILEDIYKQNSLHYNARIVALHKNRLEFSKYLLQRQYKMLDRVQNIDFFDNYVYTALNTSVMSIYNTYKDYPNLDNYMIFDIDTLNLINSDGRLLYDSNYGIDNISNFIANNYNTIVELSTTFDFYINNSKYNLDSLKEKVSVTYKNKSFLSDTVKFSLDFDWDLFKIFIDIPLTLKVKIASIVEKNWTFIFNLFTAVNRSFKPMDKFTETQIDSYIVDLYKILNLVNEFKVELINDLNIINENVEMALISNKRKLPKSLYANISKYHNYCITDMPSLKLNIIEENYKYAKLSLNELTEHTHANLENIDKYINEMLDEIIKVLYDDLESDGNKKLYEQFKSLRTNIDFKEVIRQFIKEFQDDFAELFLKDSVAMILRSNFIQLSELNIQIDSYLSNLTLYVSTNIEKYTAQAINYDILILNNKINEFKKIVRSLQS